MFVFGAKEWSLPQFTKKVGDIPPHNRRVLVKRRRTTPAQWANRFVLTLFGIAIGLTVSSLNNWRSLEELKNTFESVKRLDAELKDCLPSDQGEQIVLSIIPKDGVLKLDCSKHALINAPISKD